MQKGCVRGDTLTSYSPFIRSTVPPLLILSFIFQKPSSSLLRSLSNYLLNMCSPPLFTSYLVLLAFCFSNWLYRSVFRVPFLCLSFPLASSHNPFRPRWLLSNSPHRMYTVLNYHSLWTESSALESSLNSFPGIRATGIIGRIGGTSFSRRKASRDQAMFRPWSQSETAQCWGPEYYIDWNGTTGILAG